MAVLSHNDNAVAAFDGPLRRAVASPTRSRYDLSFAIMGYTGAQAEDEVECDPAGRSRAHSGWQWLPAAR